MHISCYQNLFKIVKFKRTLFITTLNKNFSHFGVLQIKDVTSSLGIEDDLQTMLLFNHDLGRIIYFGNLCRDKSYLKDTVILDPKWLIEVFKEVITLNNPTEMVHI